MMQPQVTIKKAQLHLVFAIVGITLAVNALILLSPDSAGKNFFGNLLRPILAAGAMGLAVTAVIRQTTKGKFGRAFFALALGLVSYFIAEVIWGYYSIGLGVEVPFPSLADGFWLAAYAPFGYGLFSLSKLYSRKGNKKYLVLFSVIAGALCAYYVQALVVSSEPITPDNELGLAITIAYPILDAILIVPALMAVISSGKGYLTAVPWIFISWIFTVIADAIFGFTAMMNIAGIDSTWNLFYNAAYITIGAGMFWHNRYMIFDSKRFANPPAK